MFPTCCGLEGQAVVLFEDRVMGCEGLCTCCHGTYFYDKSKFQVAPKVFVFSVIGF